MITPTIHEKSEWKRCAVALLQAGNEAAANAIGHASLLEPGKSMNCPDFDRIQSDYRKWLVFNETDPTP